MCLIFGMGEVGCKEEEEEHLQVFRTWPGSVTLKNGVKEEADKEQQQLPCEVARKYVVAL